MTIQARTYAGASAEQRRERRRAALLDATLEVVAQRGVKGLGVKAICAAAGLNDRYFYEQFRDCDEVLTALNDDLIFHVGAAFNGAIAATEPEVAARIRACVVTAVDFLTVDPRHGRFLIESQSSEQLRAKRQELVTTLAEVMVAGRPLLGQDAPSEEDSRLMALTIISGCLELSAMWMRGDLDTGRDKLVDFMTALALSSTRLSAQNV
ncbi:MAG: TetR/AcrR family transcriptional regulator [Mycobacterium sp.]|nr:TetR/AcrR family transcriptional regulator [Mycobacterium sp.]